MSESVKELCEQILNLDVVEMNQLLYRCRVDSVLVTRCLLPAVGRGGGAAGEDEALPR